MRRSNRYNLRDAACTSRLSMTEQVLENMDDFSGAKSRITRRMLVFFGTSLLLVLTGRAEAAKPIIRINKEPKMDVSITSITNCPDVQSIARDVFYERVNGTGRGHGTLISKIKSLSKIELTLTQCKNQCEHFQTWKFPTGCEMIQQKDTPWSPILSNFTPPVKCPMKAGYYYADDIRFDTRRLLSLPFPREDTRWKTRVEAFDGDRKLILCFNIVTTMENRRKTGRKDHP